MNKVLIVHTSWYANYINEMIKLSCKVLSENKFSWDISLAPGSIELPALAKHKLIKNEKGLCRHSFSRNSRKG